MSLNLEGDALELVAAIAGGEFVEVRCCCEPSKLVGWIRLPLYVDRTPGTRVVFRLEAETPAELTEKFHTINQAAGAKPVETLELEIGDYQEHAEGLPLRGYRRRPAFKSNHIPREQLRRIRAFVELPDVAAARASVLVTTRPADPSR